MKHFGLMMGALLLGLPAAARAQGDSGMRMQMGGAQSQADTGKPAPGITLAALVGTWKGGPADSTGTIAAGKDSSMTLTMRPDSTYTWTGLPAQVCMSKPNSKWKRLSGVNLSWCGGPGYNLKLEGKKLVMTSKQAMQGKRSYYAFTQVDTQPKP